MKFDVMMLMFVDGVFDCVMFFDIGLILGLDVVMFDGDLSDLDLKVKEFVCIID